MAKRPAIGNLIALLQKELAQYLTRCRLEWTAAELHRSEASLAKIAWDVGYTSEFSFSRAFKRHHGIPPGLYRQLLRHLGTDRSLACAA